MDSEFSSSLPLSLWTADTSSQQKTPNPLIPGPSKIEASASESEENGKVETLDILNQVQEDSALNDEDLNYLYSSKTSGNPATTTIQVIDNLDIDKNIIEDEIPINTTRATNDYEYSYGKSGKPFSRLIVREEDDKNLVRIYSNSYKGYFFCSLCNRINPKKRLRANFDGTIFLAPIIHGCKPVTLQKAEDEGKKNKSIAIKKRKSAQYLCSDESLDGIDIGGGDEGGTHEEVEKNEINFSKSLNQNCCVKRDITCENYKFYTGGWKHDKHAKIIVFENDNRNLIREYRRDSGSHYYCYGCKRATNIRNRGILKNQIFTVPSNHVCEPVNFDLFEKEQKEYEAKGPSHHHYPPPKTSEKQIRKARLRAYRERCRTRAMSCLPVWLTTTSEPPNKIARIVEENSDDNQTMVNSSLINNVSSDNSENGIERNLDLQNNHVSPALNGVKNSLAAIDKFQQQQSLDNSQIVPPQKATNSLNQQHESSKNLQQQESNPSTNVIFYYPSHFYLVETCKKVNIAYNPDGYKFCNSISIKTVNPSSSPSLTFATSDAVYHGFSCFSLYLTGNESNSSLIREMTNRYIYNNFKSLGNCMGHDFSEFNHETPIIRETLFSFSLTEIHLECLSRWFDCRIGIFNNGKWTRYGNWDDEDCDVLTFLMQIKDGKYDPILSLTV